MSKSRIEWTDRVWNPTTGCTKVSAGCANCYAEREAGRWWGYRKFSDVRCHPDRLDIPIYWKKPVRIFVDSMSDLFHDDVPDEFIEKVWLIMMHSPRHTFQILTKRPKRMLDFVTTKLYPGETKPHFNCRHIWLGVSVEDQKTADERIPLLLETSAAVRFVSVEPMLGHIDLLQSVFQPGAWSDINLAVLPSAIKTVGIDWVICGGESGPNARPMHPDWARSLRDQCVKANVPFFFKQWGEWKPICPQYPEGNEDPNLDDLDMMAHQICLGNQGTIFREDYGLKEYYWCGYQPTPSENPWFVEKVGKKAAGRLLDNRMWDEFPRSKE